MALHTLPPPVRDAAPAAPPSAPHRAPLTAAPRRSPTGRVTRRALLLSLGAHVVLAIAIFLVPVVRHSGPRTAPPRDSVQYLDISAYPAGTTAAGDAGIGGGSELAAETPTNSQDTARGRGAPVPFRFPDRVPSGIPAALPGGSVPAGPAGVRTGPRAGPAGGRLGAELGDPRLVVRPGVQVERPLTDEERARLRITRRLDALNDSLAEEAAIRHRQRNWTFRDRSGREWGFGENGTTIIAGRALPLPLPLPAIQRDRDTDNAERERLRRWSEIEEQARTADRDQVLRGRAAETRRRVDNERRRQRGEAVADTSRNP